jgi:ATP-dependent Lhr-like helicase
VTVLERLNILPEPFTRWFASRGWTPRTHQLELLAKAQAGRSVLLIAPTGGGKTLAGFLPSLVELSGAESKSRSSPLARAAPSPLVGEGGSGGSRGDAHASTLAPNIPTPTPDPSPQGGGEKRKLISIGRSVRREGGLHTL